jgi:hypothetical protein
MQRRLSVEQDEAIEIVNKGGSSQSSANCLFEVAKRKKKWSLCALSVPQMPLDDPTVLQRARVVLDVTQIDSVSGVSDDVSSSGMVERAVIDELLQVRDVVGSDWSYTGSTERRERLAQKSIGDEREQERERRREEEDGPRSGYVSVMAMDFGTPTWSS